LLVCLLNQAASPIALIHVIVNASEAQTTWQPGTVFNSYSGTTGRANESTGLIRRHRKHHG